MSSTDEARIRRFYRRRLRSTAEQLRQRGVRFFPLGPEPEAETWYVDGSRDAPEFVELEVEDCEAALRALWEEQELPELAALAGPLLELARKLEVKEEGPGEVSPFVYVMY